MLTMFDQDENNDTKGIIRLNNYLLFSHDVANKTQIKQFITCQNINMSPQIMMISVFRIPISLRKYWLLGPLAPPPSFTNEEKTKTLHKVPEFGTGKRISL